MKKSHNLRDLVENAAKHLNDMSITALPFDQDGDLKERWAVEQRAMNSLSNKYWGCLYAMNRQGARYAHREPVRNDPNRLYVRRGNEEARDLITRTTEEHKKNLGQNNAKQSERQPPQRV